MRLRRGVILPVVLFVLLLVGLLAAMFSFRVSADLASTRAVELRMQTRLAAEAGVEFAKLLLATDRANLDTWYNDIDNLHRVIVWTNNGDSSVWGTTDEGLDAGSTTYRFSLVADDLTDDEDFARFGITDESSKLDLNLATESQLLTLVTAAVGDEQSIDPGEIVAAILDWRDTDTRPRGREGDTEVEYYRRLEVPYRVKNGPFDTVEELLLVKGVTNNILYGEDFDRNGLLTPNERDGEESFPVDNEDEQLNRGLYPYLTVTSYEDNVSNDRRQRIYLFGDENLIREQLLEEFENDPEVVDYIITVTRGQGPRSGAGTPGSTGNGSGGSQNPTGNNNTGSGAGENPTGNNNTGSGAADDGDKSDGRRQVRDEQENDQPQSGQDPPNGKQEGESSGGNVAEDDAGEAGSTGGEQGDTAGDGTTAGAQGSAPMRHPVSLLLPRSVSGELREGPVGPQHLAILWDRTTMIPSDQRQVRGLINVNTAPRLVLKCIDGLTDEQIDRIIEVREGLGGEDKATPAWLATEEVLDLLTLERIAPSITARGQQFTIESIGYADHVGMVTRLQTVVDMVGPIAQTIYYRDISYLGARFPIREEDLESQRVR